MATHLTVGCPVRVINQKSGYWGREGVVVNMYGMVSAAQIKRVKVVVRFPHSRTKTKSVDVAMEIQELDWMDSKFASYVAPVMRPVVKGEGLEEFYGMSDQQLAEYITCLIYNGSKISSKAVAELDRRINRS